MKMKGLLFFTWAVAISFLTIKNTNSISKIEVNRGLDLAHIEAIIQSLGQTVYGMRQELNVPNNGIFE
jgi:hypothetical protein